MDKEDKDGYSALMSAVRNGHLKVVKILYQSEVKK